MLNATTHGQIMEKMYSVFFARDDYEIEEVHSTIEKLITEEVISEKDDGINFDILNILYRLGIIGYYDKAGKHPDYVPLGFYISPFVEPEFNSII